MACFVAMLTDAEAEVRAASVGHLARMVTWGGPSLFERHLQPLLPALADDVVMEVRSKCALALMDAANSDTLEDAVILQSFGPLFEAFLQDEYHEVQLQVLSNLDKIAHLLSGLSGVVTVLLQMSKAANSRVREAVARLLPHLAEARGLEFFNTVLLEPAWKPLLLDQVASVRMSIVSCMALLVRVAGHDFMLGTLLPMHIALYNQYNYTYLVRMTILHAHIETVAECNAGPLWEEVIAQILRGLTDKVPNVRTVAAKGFARIVVEGDPDVVQAQIRPALEKCLQEETDPDCMQACQAALDRLK
jgi:serine/threonine-protein phosphatase 2A regulatory subunit A